MLGRHYWQKGQFKKARSVFLSILQYGSNTSIADVFACWASLELRLRRVQFARERLNEALDRDPFHIVSLVTLASLEARSGLKTFVFVF